MATNYTGFNYGGAQYTTGAAPAAYNSTSAQIAAYPAVTNATYANAAYQTAAAAAGHSGYVAASNTAAGYGYDYSRPVQTYDSSKTYYQQAPTTYNTTPSGSISKTHYSAPPVKNINAGVKTIGKDKLTGGGKQPGVVATAATTASVGYASYDAALYSAASLYVAQQQQQQCNNSTSNKITSSTGSGANWSQFKGGRHNSGGGNTGNRGRGKSAPRPQQLHYCEVCKISCAGPQTYREHLEGQKHKKREASLKMQASAQSTSQNRGNNYHCELCDVTCTGNDAYAAHVRGSKHQKVVKLHQKLGKPIPSDEPKKISKINFVPATNGATTLATVQSAEKDNDVEMTTDDNDNANVGNQDVGENTDNIKPVGGEYIEEIKDDEGKILSFNCKLCDCKFNDPNAKEMHMKGRRHRLQYKRKVQPDLVVDFKPTPRQRRLAEARAQRALMQSHRGTANTGFNEEQDGGALYWDEQRRRAQYDDEYDYSNWLARSFAGSQRGFGGRAGGSGHPPFFGMMPGGAGSRRPESTDDRHAIARHAEIYPKEEELQTIQRIVSHTERALKYVSDSFADKPEDGSSIIKKEILESPQIKDGRDNQMFSFQKEAEANNVRLLKGVMRVGFLAKGLLLQGDNVVELVVLCAEKPTVGLLKRVVAQLPNKLKDVTGEQNPVDYHVEMSLEDSAVIVSDECITVKISLTSPLLREAGGNPKPGSTPGGVGDTALLPREPCLQALAELRHAKWFQARATGLQSCVMVIRILRDLCHRVPSWQALPQWSLELLVEKVISSAGFPLSPGDCMRRIMEALATGFIINGPGLLDPCEKEAQDALQQLSKQQKEDLTVSAQQFLRYIAFRQIYKVLGMDQLPALKFPMRPWRLNRKRRRSSGKSGLPGDNEKGDGDDEVAAEKTKSFAGSNSEETDKLETENQRQQATLTNLSLCDEEFIHNIRYDIELYLRKRRNCVLLLPPVNNYRRFLIHSTCESFRQYDLFTFSVGQGPWRRTVICSKNQLLDPIKCTDAIATNTKLRRQSQVKNWRTDRKPEQFHSTVPCSYSQKKNLILTAKMGVERHVCNGSAHASITRCTKNSFVDIYRPPALRCQSIESADCNVSVVKITEAKVTAPVSSVSCNNSPTHAQETKNCNTVSPPSPDGASLLIARTTNNNPHSDSTEYNKLPHTTTAAAVRRERRPDRAVYIPRARRSQTTPPAATQSQSSSATANNITEPQLPITLNTNGLVSTPPSLKADESSKDLLTKKSRSLGMTKERKERTKRKSKTENSIVLEHTESNNIALILVPETKDTNIQSLKKDCDNNKQEERMKNSKNTKNKTSKNPKQIQEFGLPKTENLERNHCGTRNGIISEAYISRQSNPNMDSAESDGNYSNMHIEDVMTADRVTPKCDIEEQELKKASKEINRSNRRIMKQTFDSDVLEIPETIDKVENYNINLPAALQRTLPLRNTCSNIETTTDEEDEDDDWENMYDESGECLDPKIIQELTASVGKVKIEFPKMDYSAYLTKQSILNEEEFPHVLEVSNFPVEFKNQDLLMLFSEYKESGFDIKWVDDTHALAIFSSSRIAAEVLTIGHPFVVLKPLGEATVESRLKARKCAASLQPYRPRPETCAALARRLVTGALGVRLKTAAAERENEKRVLREAKERKLLAAKQRDEAWES